MDPPERSSRLEMEMQPLAPSPSSSPRCPVDPDPGRPPRPPNSYGRTSTRAKIPLNRNIPSPTMATVMSNGESVIAIIDSDKKKKKMLLIFLGILFVAMVGVVAVKGNAVEAEKIVQEGDFGIANHDDDNKNAQGSTSSSSSAKPVPAHIIDLDGYLPKSMINSENYVLPGTENAPPLSAAKGRPYYPIINHFQNRNPNGYYAKKWGYFDFEDPDPKWRGKMRPQPDFAAVPNRDVKNTDFPDGAWQKDKEYMARFLEEAKKLVNRTIEAVYGEFGVGIPQDGSVELTDQFLVNRAQFYQWPKPSEQSLDGMTRRFIHHIMTGDTFKLVLGGHSAAAGHGAGFNASYVHQAGLVLEPVFAHLGVEFRSYNFAQGGMGTFQQALAGMDLREKDADILIWDSSMTETNPAFMNFFFRQGLLAGNRAPFMYSGNRADPGGFEVIGASVGSYGELGYSPITTSEEQAQTLPWAARFNKCAAGTESLCKSREYDGKCWVERPDFQPQSNQDPFVGGQAKWHPGPKAHRVRGRAIALSVLFMLQHALNKWEELGDNSGYPLSEERWHVTDFYIGIKEKVPTVGGCYQGLKIGNDRRALREANRTEFGSDRRLDLEGEWPPRLCNIPLQGRSLWGPRSNPMETSLLSILKKNAYGDVEPNIRRGANYMIGPDYTPPDLAAPWSTPPEPEVNPWEIAGSRRLESIVNAAKVKNVNMGNSLSSEVHALPSLAEEAAARGTLNTTAVRLLAEDPDIILPGLGFQVDWGRIGVCDGTTHAWCDKSTMNTCLFSAAQDNRGKICFNPMSGWLVFDLKNVKNGFIGARMEAWHGSGEISITAGWKEVNNGGKGNYENGTERHLLEKEHQEMTARLTEQMAKEIEEDILLGDSTRRRLGGGQSCGQSGEYIFEFAINGKIVASWDKALFCKHYTRAGYNLDLVKFLDDVTVTGDIELAMRMSPNHSNKGGVMCITHLYWS